MDIEKIFTKKAEEAGIPGYMIEGIVRYIVGGVKPGSFLTKVLENDLAGAYGAADQVNSYSMRAYVDFLYNSAPMECWGSPGKVALWNGLNNC